MVLPRFTSDNVNSSLCHEGIDAAFQDFVVEVLRRDFPGLYAFSCTGKDGAIDGVQETDGARVVVEAKQTGADGLAVAQSSWRKVAKRLDKHLADPAGPTKGQSQYRPWYSTAEPIEHYVFATSSSFANLNQHDELKNEIRDFFVNLASTRPHLAHLGDMAVTVYDWGKLWESIQDQPRLVFRWFPATRPTGLVLFGEARWQGTFRSYLTAEKLP